MEWPHVQAQDHPDRQLAGRDVAEGSAGGHEPRQGRYPHLDRRPRRLSRDALRSGRRETDRGGSRFHARVPRHPACACEMSEPVWVDRHVLELLHSESIAEHGGADGLRGGGVFESSLARPQNLFAYEAVADVDRLAASYIFGLAKNHAFVDGNKRVAFIAGGLFLRLNGWR